MEKEIYQVRYNPMKITSLTTFANLRGGWSQGKKQVYFIRCIGYDDHYRENISSLDRMLAPLNGSGQGGYGRIGRPGPLTSQEDIDFYTQAHKVWEEKRGEGLSLKSITSGSPLEAAAKGALTKVAALFREYTPNGNESIVRNFTIKLFYWADQVIPMVCRNWKWEDHYKLAVCGALKKQEYLFCYFLTLLGIHVLILSPEKELEVGGGLLDLSEKLELGKKGKIDVPVYSREQAACQGTARSACPGTVQPARPGGDRTISQPARPGGDRTIIQPARPGGDRPVCQSPDQAAKVVIPPRKSGNTKGQPRPLTMEGPGERREKTFEELALLASSIVMIAIHDDRNEVIGTGSGIMLGPGGYILTNNHVACGGASYSVRIEDDEQVYRTGEVIKYHSVLDLAIIRIDRKLTPLPIYKGEQKLVRGQRVVAIGSPLGFFNSVSDGIISGFRRIHDVDMIQFTAPISHGSSGGALLNMHGEVIGISTAGVDNGQNINLAVDYRDILTFTKGFL